MTIHQRPARQPATLRDLGAFALLSVLGFAGLCVGFFLVGVVVGLASRAAAEGWGVGFRLLGLL